MTRTKPALLLALALSLLLALSLSACRPRDAEESTPPPQTDSVSPDVQPTGDTDEPAQSPDPDPEDPDDPYNVAVGDRDTTMTVILEGEEETVPAIRHTSWMGYAMTYDPEWFTLTEEDGGDYYLAETVEGRPNVYVAVSIVDGLSAEETVEGLRTQLELEEEGRVLAFGAHDYAATCLHYAAGAGGNDATTEFYVTEQNGTVFLVELGCFVDGTEGFGARLSAMLATMTF